MLGLVAVQWLVSRAQVKWFQEKWLLTGFYSFRKEGIHGLGQVSSPKREGGGEREGKGRSCRESALETKDEVEPVEYFTLFVELNLQGHHLYAFLFSQLRQGISFF